MDGASVRSSRILGVFAEIVHGPLGTLRTVEIAGQGIAAEARCTLAVLADKMRSGSDPPDAALQAGVVAADRLIELGAIEDDLAELWRRRGAEDFDDAAFEAVSCRNVLARPARWSRCIALDLVDGDLDTLRLVAAGCHHDGRIREAAVLRLADRQHPAAVAVLAIRAGDWAAEVRQAARTVIAGWPSPPDGASLRMLTELAFALGVRCEGAWLAQHVDELLRDLPAQRLEPLLSARDRRVRRAAYRVAIAAGRLGLDRLMRAAVRESDLPIRIMCARVAVTAADPVQLRALLASRIALVRARHCRH